MRAIYTLVKDILYVISICKEIQIDIKLPAIKMEDNAAVIMIAQKECAYLKRCKHFLMVINYVREQVQLGLIAINKIDGEQNDADLQTKKLRGQPFTTKANNIMGITNNIEHTDTTHSISDTTEIT